MWMDDLGEEQHSDMDDVSTSRAAFDCVCGAYFARSLNGAVGFVYHTKYCSCTREWSTEGRSRCCSRAALTTSVGGLRCLAELRSLFRRVYLFHTRPDVSCYFTLCLK